MGDWEDMTWSAQQEILTVMVDDLPDRFPGPITDRIRRLAKAGRFNEALAIVAREEGLDKPRRRRRY